MIPCTYCQGTGIIHLRSFRSQCGVCFGAGSIDPKDTATLLLAEALRR